MLGLKTVVLECKDIPQLLDFYSQLLKWPVVYKEETFVRIQSGDTGMCIGFQYAEDYIPPVWPSQVGKQQMMCHLDFGVTDKNELEAATKKAVQLGAKIADEQFGEDEWITLIDPAGHPFCFVLWD
ncbi:VOC family protein [Clostridium swellfunianum]|uniref:VOC family protein n=1 Tax=Clostridium swellfunianum TaxID=1367462 RepID=UPI0020309CE7|nr:VOC family protein [Clostridium swellfunianum]MCM0648919.1 VOC family protein [Clostridium swellfunianum]